MSFLIPILIIVILIVIGVVLFLKFKKIPVQEPDIPGSVCYQSAPCTVNNKCVVKCVLADELDQCPLDDGSCQKCPVGSVITHDRRSCVESDTCDLPNLICNNICTEEKDLCWNGTCPGPDCPPNADAMWKAFMEFLHGIFTVQGLVTMVGFEKFSEAMQTLKTLLENKGASFTEEAFVTKMKEKISTKLSTKVTSHLEANNPFYKFRKAIKSVGKLFESKPTFNLFKSLNKLPEFEGKTESEIRNLLKNISEAKIEEIATRASQNIVGDSLKASAKDFITRVGERAALGIAGAINPAMYVLDGFMISGMVLDLLNLGGWTQVLNTDTLNNIMYHSNQDFVDSSISSVGLYPVIVGPLVYHAMKFEAGDETISLDDLLVQNIAEYFPFHPDGSASPLFVHLCHVMYNEWVVHQDMTPNDIGNRFEELIKEMPIDQFSILIRESERLLCEKDGKGVYFDPFDGTYTDPLPPWGMVCSFTNKEDTEAANGWFPGKGPKYSNFEWRSNVIIQHIPLAFENVDHPIYLKFPDAISGAAILIDDSNHRLCNTGQNVHFPTPLNIGAVYTSYQLYDNTTGVCYNNPKQCDLWGMQNKPVQIEIYPTHSQSYANCVPRDGIGANIARFFIGDTMLQEEHSSAYGVNATAFPSNCKDILADKDVTINDIKAHYTPPN